MDLRDFPQAGQFTTYLRSISLQFSYPRYCSTIWFSLRILNENYFDIFPFCFICDSKKC